MRLTLLFLFYAASYGAQAQSDSGVFADLLPRYKTNEGWHSAGPDAIFYRYCEKGLCQGDFKYYYDRGALKHKGFYKDGRIYGKYYDYYENGQLKDSGEIYNGHQVDTSWSYYPNGRLQRMCVHLTGGGYGSPLISYYENGQVEDHEYLDTLGYFRYRYMMAENGDTILAEYLIDKNNLIYQNYSRYDNGKMEYEGQTSYSLKTGYKYIGTWRYYKEEGDLIEVKEYPTFKEFELKGK